jgi:hypothetical protein
MPADPDKNRRLSVLVQFLLVMQEVRKLVNLEPRQAFRVDICMPGDEKEYKAT